MLGQLDNRRVQGHRHRLRPPLRSAQNIVLVLILGRLGISGYIGGRAVVGVRGGACEIKAREKRIEERGERTEE